jgi:tetratricopeptide (TPR) repeat protein
MRCTQHEGLRKQQYPNAMKKILILPFWIAMLQLAASAQSLDTQGDYSPTVVAKSFTATYGVRSDAILAILDVYAKQGLPPQDRKARTEALIKDYKKAIPQVKGISQLTKDEQNSLGIAAEAGLVQALNWDMFARQYYLSTRGAYSPAIVAQGDVSIWYGIPEPALRTLAGRLEANAVELGEFEAQLEELAEKYNSLKKEFETYGPGDPVVRQAEMLLEEGKLEEAEALLESDYRVSKKRLADKAYLFGRTKELLLKFEEAAEGYRDAVNLDPENLVYLIIYGNNEETLGHFEESIEAFEKCLNQQLVRPKLNKAQMASLLNNMGMALGSVGRSKSAIECYEKAQKIDTICKEWGPIETGAVLSNLGLAWLDEGNPAKALAYLEQAFHLDTIALGISHPSTAIDLSNMGLVWIEMNELEKAESLFEKALGIDTLYYGWFHPNVAVDLSNLGYVARSKGKFEKALLLFEHSLSIDTAALGVLHPEVAIRYRHLGYTWSKMGNYREAQDYFEKTIRIDTIVYGYLSEVTVTDLSNLAECMQLQNNKYLAVSFFHSALSVSTKIAEPTSPTLRELGKKLALVSFELEQELLGLKKLNEANSLLIAALNALDSTDNISLSVACLLEIGILNQLLGDNLNALKSIEDGLSRIKQLTFDFYTTEPTLPDSVTQSPNYQDTRDSMQLGPLSRTLRLHRIQCLQALGHHKEAKAAAKTLITDALAAKDEIVIADLRKDGWLKD